MNIIQSGITAENSSIAIIIARFNEFINKNLLLGALDTLKRIGQVHEENILKIYVPGTYEIPTIASYIAKSGKYDAIIAIGTIIKGQTDHFKYIANDTSSSLSRISTQYFLPITLGILTTKNIEQSIERSGTKMGNKGSDAALAALEMINVMKKLKKVIYY
ncbi:6,7-dimethyl-8-ribityllumazine synthase [Buchnera aphidicola]|uniref:6,7-dimethyl-8-ribityllumazine synthase n=2 Tax=Buchnera aphidicola TaxID=9 RepID=RISB_BUCA5|nr:6,7-dimethyl-8-ribityllumazine synthase [Buchnera aphidicola]B8D7Y8.1 RecName: Full=6,7-dimethyl-8-ribityllumazine synthase; Short=DMRL synthase; Short=LS; Short=Lumazine synthase [Buchnera aphidicola str. Tuc7 (Acyrthosiphon pisum)]B8D9N6.1 RecName: Full=6,7-dimethyl-8-ribityllumazine synthase; Short=DMRL synthase; Short=LS; Short=Lumazine synthase [Buchnera aphidicola str. 5A (Acyrthosiphon pisum)]ADP66842.1 6,7-dimethyl-8-ribityllumazine synthase [Buchnera aphidicola str. TLW03 (Acyrthosip